jgi:hypothetical protein
MAILPRLSADGVGSFKTRLFADYLVQQWKILIRCSTQAVWSEIHQATDANSSLK